MVLQEFVPANGQEKQDSYAGLTGVARAMGLKPHGTCTTLGEKRERPAKRQLRQRAAKRQRQDPIDGASLSKTSANICKDHCHVLWTLHVAGNQQVLS